MRALLIGNKEAQIAGLLLKDAGFMFDVTGDGSEGAALAGTGKYDIIFLDWDLHGDLSARGTLRSMRFSKTKTPVLAIGKEERLRNTVDVLGLGGDEYMTWPVDVRALRAHSLALIRRAAGYTESILRIGDLTLDLETRTVGLGGHPVRFRAKEYLMMEVLALHKNGAVARDIIINHMYGDGHDGVHDGGIFDIYLGKARQKLALASISPKFPEGRAYIENVWGFGYKLNELPCDETLYREPMSCHATGVAYGPERRLIKTGGKLVIV